MNNEDDYVTSGALELYAAGALSEEERLEVDRMAATSPAVRTALDEACAVMEQYATLYAVQPSPALRARVLDQIEPHTPASVEEEQQPVRPLYPVEDERGSSAYKWMFAASIALFLLSGFMSIASTRTGRKQRKSWRRLWSLRKRSRRIIRQPLTS